MSFSAALSGAGSFATAAASIYGARQSANAARNALEEQRQARFEQARQAQRDYEMMLQQLQREREIASYYRTTNDRNAGLALDQRDYERGISQTNFDLARDDRAYTMDRQATLDRAAAERRAFDLQQLLRNQGLSQNERQTALDELRQAQAIARGERVFSEAELRRAQAQRESERAYDLDRQSRAQRIAEEERGISIEDRDRVLGRTGEMFDALRAARSDLGEVGPTRRFTEADIDAEAQRRAGIYGRAVDRAVDRVASVSEAGLIRRGVDRSSTGDAVRGAVAERVAPLYEDAYRRAADDALRYISGTQSTLFAGDDQEAERRGRVLSEITGIYGAPLQFESRLPDLRSAQGPILNPASAVYDRNLASANDYRAPLQVGSAIYEPRNMDAGVAATLPMILARFDPARSSGVNPAFQQLPFSSPSGFLSASNTASNAAFGAAGANARTLLEGSRADNAAAGRSLQNLFERGGGWLDSMFGGGSGGWGSSGWMSSAPGNLNQLYSSTNWSM
jgi:hypothetical protein